MKFRIILGLAVMLLASCSTLPSLTSYAVSEQQLSDTLNAQLTTLQKQAAVAGIPVTLNVDHIKVTIGPQQRQVVQLTAAATATVKAFGLQYPAGLTLDLEGQPYYDREQKAIFVRSLNLLDSQVEAGGYRGNLAPLSRELMQVLNHYLAAQPVYRLDTTNPLVKLATSSPLTLEIEQGKLVLHR